jgi:hypothetical protein
MELTPIHEQQAKAATLEFMRENERVNLARRGLLLKLALVTKKITGIKKNGYNAFSKYDYVQASDLIREVRAAMLENNLYHWDEELDCQRTEHGKNFHCRLTLVAHLVDLDTGAELRVPYVAVAADTLDKDIWKAKTNGLKYLYLNLFKPDTNMQDAEWEQQQPNGVYQKQNDEKESGDDFI